MSTTYIMGYSLDAVIEAVRTKWNGEEVEFLLTGRLGEPLDTYHDMLSGSAVGIISALTDLNMDCDEYINPRHIYIPYDKVKIKNSQNGIIQFPLNKKSFEDETEWKDACAGFSNPKLVECMNDKGNSPSKLLSTMKDCLPANFVETFYKPLSVTRWSGVKLSNLTMYGYNYDYPFDLIDKDYNETFYMPKISYESLCQLMLQAADIKVTPVTSKVCSKIITDKNFTDRLIVMDNRIDAYMNYVCGKLDRVRMRQEEVKMPIQFANARDGFYLTPLSDFWGVIVLGDRAFKLEAVPVNTLYDDFVSEIPLSRNNVKVHSQYLSMIQYYGGNKTLDIMQRARTMIK